MNTEHMNPLVRELFTRISAAGRTVESVSRAAGVYPKTVRNWGSVNPNLANFVAVVNAIGGEVVIRWPEARSGD